MNLNTILLIAVLLATSASSAISGVDTDFATREALVKRYYAAIHLDRTMAKMTAAMMPAMLDQISKKNPGFTPGMRQAIVDSVEGASSELLPKIETRMAAVMADKFSVEELQAVVDFYESPIGQKITAKSTEMATSVGPIIHDLMPEMQKNILQRFCAKVDCTGPKPPINMPT